MRCDICKSPLAATNIGYVRTLERGSKVFECKKCHRNVRRNKNKKLSSSWIFVA